MYEFFTDDFAGLSAALWNWIATGICILFLVLLIVGLIRLLRGPKLGSRRGRNSRLAVTDATAIGDERRKLVLVRRDNVEHLLLIGGPSDLVIETNIVKPQIPNKSPNKIAEPPAKPFSKAVKDPPRQDPALSAPEPAKPVAIAEPTPAPTVAPPKPVATPEPVPQPAVAPSPLVAPQVTAPTPSTQPSTTSSSVATAAAVIAAPIAAAVTDEKAPEPEAIADSVSTPSEETQTTAAETSEVKLGPVEEMDALLKEISADK